MGRIKNLYRQGRKLGLDNFDMNGAIVILVMLLTLPFLIVFGLWETALKVVSLVVFIFGGLSVKWYGEENNK